MGEKWGRFYLAIHPTVCGGSIIAVGNEDGENAVSYFEPLQEDYDYILIDTYPSLRALKCDARTILCKIIT